MDYIYANMGVQELRALAEERGVTLLRNDTKRHIIDRLLKADKLDAEAPDGSAYTPNKALIDLKRQVVDALEAAFGQFDPQFANSHEARIIKNHIVASLKKLPELQPGPAVMAAGPRPSRDVSAEQVITALEKKPELFAEVLVLLAHRWNTQHGTVYKATRDGLEVGSTWTSLLRLEVPDAAPAGLYKVSLSIHGEGILSYRMTYGSAATEVCHGEGPTRRHQDFEWEQARMLEDANTIRLFNVWVWSADRSLVEQSELVVRPI